MSDINFCNTKEQLNHLGEVVTGKVDGSPTGADIETSTLPYTGQVRKTLPALEGEYQGDIDNFVQVSDQLIVDKTAEFDASISNKEAEADAAIDSYRLLSKGEYAAGIDLEDKFQYITYNGESYFATNPPYTTTATTPDADVNLFAGGYTTIETVANKIGNPNLLSNQNFLTPSPEVITHPSETPTAYPAGTEIFSGVYAGSSGVTVTLIAGRVNCSAGSYEYRLSNTNGIERVLAFTSSVSDYDGNPATNGVSHALVGDEYVVTVTPAAGDVFSVKLEDGDFATRHSFSLNSYYGVYGSIDVRSLGLIGDGSVELSALQSAVNKYSSLTIPDGLNINLGGGTLNLKSDLSIYMTSSSLISNGVINSRIAGLSNLNIPLLNINKVEVDLGGQSSSQPVGDGVVLGIVYGLNSRLILRHLRGGGVSLIKLTNDADKISGAPLAIANTLNSDFGPIKILGDFDFGIEFVGETASEPCAGDCTFESIIAEKTPGTAEVNGHHGIYIKGVSDCYFGYIKATGFSDSNNQRNDIKIRDSQRNKFAKLTCGYLQLTSDANINSQNYTLDNKLKNTTVTGQAQIFSGASGQHGGNEIENFSGKLNGTSCNLNPNYNYTWKLRGDIDTKDGDYQPVDLNLMFSDAIVSGGMLFDGSTNVFDGVKGERVTFNHPIYSINRDIDLKDFYVNGGINMQPTAGTRKITLSHGTVDGRLVTNSFGTRNIEADWSFLDVKSDREPNINDRPNLLSRYRFVSFDDGYSLSGDFTPIP